MAKKKETTEMVKTDPTDEAPNYIEEGGEGLEEVTSNDLIVPRLKLMQALSPEVQEELFKSGDIVNSLTGKMWAKRGDLLHFIPIKHYKEWIQWAPREEGGGIVARSNDPKSELARLSHDRDSEVHEYHNFIVITRDHGPKKPVLISCKGTNHKKARALLGLAKYRGNYPLYAGLYTVEAQVETNKSGQSYYVFQFENAGWVESDEFETAKEIFVTLGTADVKIDDPDDEIPHDDGEI